MKQVRERAGPSKIDWQIILSFIFIVWLADQISKSWAITYAQGVQYHEFLGFSLQQNPGVIFGIFLDLPEALRVVSISTAGSFLIFIYAFIQYLLPFRALILRIGLSILLGGVLGNVTDRIRWGSAIDFIFIKIANWNSPIFNLSDLFQWVGYIMIAYVILKNPQSLWPQANKRKKVWINKNFQIRYILIILGISVGFSIVSGIFGYTYLRVLIEENSLKVPGSAKENYLLAFVIIYSLISILFMSSLFIIATRLSHRIAGPIYSFEKFLTSIIRGESKDFKLRTGDDFKHLEELGKEIKSILEEREKTSKR